MAPSEAVLILEELLSTSKRMQVFDYDMLEQHCGVDLREKRHLVKTVKNRLWANHRIAISPIPNIGYYLH